ncbi:MAG: LiaI-LiaF-like domain-containing protein [Anaerolineales bacterium]
MSGSSRSSLIWGVLLVILGLGFLLNNFGLVPKGIASLWPLLVIGVGLWMLGRAVARRAGEELVGGIMMLALGAFWLLQNYGRVDNRSFLPVLLIALGVGALLRNVISVRGE